MVYLVLSRESKRRVYQSGGNSRRLCQCLIDIISIFFGWVMELSFNLIVWIEAKSNHVISRFHGTHNENGYHNNGNRSQVIFSNQRVFLLMPIYYQNYGRKIRFKRTSTGVLSKSSPLSGKSPAGIFPSFPYLLHTRGHFCGLMPLFIGVVKIDQKPCLLLLDLP